MTTIIHKTKNTVCADLSLKHGELVAVWSLNAIQGLRMAAVPGEEFILTRDLLIYPRGNFLATGLLGVVGTALFPRASQSPFVGGVLLSTEYTNSELVHSLSPLLPYRYADPKVFKLLSLVYKTVLSGLGGPSFKSKIGAYRLGELVRRGVLPPIS